MSNYKLLVMVAIIVWLAGCHNSSRQFITPGYGQFVEAKTTFQNTPIQLKFSTDLNPDCSNRGYPVHNVIEQPKSGVLKFAHTQDFTNYITIITQAECNKKRNPGSEVKYVPDSGFVGTDSAVIETVFPNGNVVRTRYNIAVRPQS